MNGLTKGDKIALALGIVTFILGALMDTINSLPNWWIYFGVEPQEVTSSWVTISGIAVPTGTFLIGFAIGGWARGRSMAKASAERDREQAGRERAVREEQERLKRERVNEGMRKEFRHLDFRGKEYLYVLYARGHVDLDIDASGSFKELGIRGYLDYENFGDGKTRWTLEPWARRFFDENPDVLDEAEESVEKTWKENASGGEME